MADERVPAGWYPDPSGLPQLRWWDNRKWTEFVSDSQVESQVAEERADEPASPVIEIPVAGHARPALVQSFAPAPVDLGSAFDAVFGEATRPTREEPARASVSADEPRLAAAFDEAFGVSFAPTADAAPVREQAPAAHAPAPAPAPAEPIQAEPIQAEPINAEPIRVAPQYVEPSHAEPVRADPDRATPITLVSAPGVDAASDPMENLFVSSATSPIGVGTGETIGEALMRALQSA